MIFRLGGTPLALTLQRLDSLPVKGPSKQKRPLTMSKSGKLFLVCTYYITNSIFLEQDTQQNIYMGKVLIEQFCFKFDK